jgi:hypothetical protein
MGGMPVQVTSTWGDMARTAFPEAHLFGATAMGKLSGYGTVFEAPHILTQARFVAANGEPGCSRFAFLSQFLAILASFFIPPLLEYLQTLHAFRDDRFTGRSLHSIASPH